MAGRFGRESGVAQRMGVRVAGVLARVPRCSYSSILGVHVPCAEVPLRVRQRRRLRASARGRHPGQAVPARRPRRPRRLRHRARADGQRRATGQRCRGRPPSPRCAGCPAPSGATSDGNVVRIATCPGGIRPLRAGKPVGRRYRPPSSAWTPGCRSSAAAPGGCRCDCRHAPTARVAWIPAAGHADRTDGLAGAHLPRLGAR